MKIQIRLTNSDGVTLTSTSQIREIEEMVYNGDDEHAISGLLAGKMNPQILGLIRLFRDAENLDA